MNNQVPMCCGLQMMWDVDCWRCVHEWTSHVRSYRGR